MLIGLIDLSRFAQDLEYSDLDREVLAGYYIKPVNYPDGYYLIDKDTFLFCVNQSEATIRSITQGPQVGTLIMQDA